VFLRVPCAISVAFHVVSNHSTVFDLNGQSVTIYGLNNKATEMAQGTLKNTGPACTLTLSVGEGLDYAYGGSIAESGNGITLLKTGAGKQTLSGDISNLNIEIQDGTINTPGTAFASSAAVQSGGTLRLTTDGTTMDSLSAGTITLPEDMVLSLEFLDGTPRAAGEFQILTQTDPFTYTAEYLTSLLPDSQSYWTLRVDGNAVFASVNASAVPEPSAWLLLFLGAGLLSMTHFKRKKTA
nr:PEP-CTERM sorting domain-containing protein [Thermoguttaceae bacterium]